MSGRAGRRGLDDKGIVILMIDEKMSPTSCKEVVKVIQRWFQFHKYLYINVGLKQEIIYSYSSLVNEFIIS